MGKMGKMWAALFTQLGTLGATWATDPAAFKANAVTLVIGSLVTIASVYQVRNAPA